MSDEALALIFGGAFVGIVALAAAGVHTLIGAANFLVLQWFGVRVARVIEYRPIPGDLVGAMLRAQRLISEEQYRCHPVVVGHKLLRWVWPLTGWWGPYRWIARRGSFR